MLELTLKLALSIRGPFTTKGVAGGQYGVDAVLLRNHLGQPVLPGSQVRGRLRDALEEIESAVADPHLSQQILEWFGPAVQLAADEEDFVSDIDEAILRHHAWHFSDLTAIEPKDTGDDYSSSKFLTRIAIDSSTGAVREQALLVAETPVATGERLTFFGDVSVSAGSLDKLCTAVDRLYRGLCWIPSLGSFRTVGYGQLDQVQLDVGTVVSWDATTSCETVDYRVRTLLSDLQGSPIVAATTPNRSSSPQPWTVPTLGNAFQLRLQFQDAFCLGGIKRSRNLVESERHVSGAVLKGAVAFQIQRMLRLPPRTDLADAGTGRWAKLCEHFGAIRFLAAFPAERETKNRPVFPPLSLVKGAADEICRDVALSAGPFLFRDSKSQHLEAPSFRVDWKDAWSTPGFDSGWAETQTETRLHTAIDPLKRRVRTKYLFAQELVQTDGLDWIGGIDLSAVPSDDRVTVRQQLFEFLQSVTLRLGKTKARCRVGLEPPASESQIDSNGPWVITLQSQALIADPEVIRREWSESASNPLHRQYSEYWHTVSNKSLQLVRYFADQSLQGGMLARRSLAKTYEPFFVTEAGSVFVLTAVSGQEKAAVQFIREWLNSGIPLPSWAASRYGTSFRTNPFLRQDGAGEIIVNHRCHRALAPDPVEIEVLS
jgi:hypothetical protein